MAEPEEPVEWYENSYVVVASLVCCFPVSFLFVAASRWHPNVKAAFAGLYLFLIGLSFFSSSLDRMSFVGGGTTLLKPQRRAQPTETHVPAPVPPPPLDPPGSFRDGSFIVGSDLAAGTYRTRVAGQGCYWARLAGFSGELADLLASENEPGPAIVTISKADKGFESKRCGLWVPDLAAITKSPTAPFADGVYLVGTDIAPGTWRASTSTGCYWVRLRGFSGHMRDMIANGNARPIVTIARTDKGFKSHRCGTWSKIDSGAVHE